jgi:cyclic pyranopterin phosphate synthase
LFKIEIDLEERNKFSHLNKKGDPAIVDITAKIATNRVARAKCLVKLPIEIINQFKEEGPNTAKGPVFQTAILSGIMASKKTSELIPLCHPISLDNCSVDITINADGLIEIVSEAKTTGKTGVEMEALTAASVAALTIYDMCKGFSHEIEILQVKLISKSGGKSEYYDPS